MEKTDKELEEFLKNLREKLGEEGAKNYILTSNYESILKDRLIELIKDFQLDLSVLAESSDISDFNI